MTVTKTGAKARIISKPKAIVATVLTNNGGALTKGDTYIFEHILKDSTKFSQDDPDKQTIENEVSDTPIKEVVTVGAYNFETTVEDIQPDIVCAMCGFEANEGKTKIYAPAGYKEVYAEIAVVLDGGDGKLVAQIAPKVQLNSKLILESLSSSVAGFTLAGSAQNTSVQDGSKTYDTPFFIDYNYTMPV